jgi:hypothetical protein
MIVLSLRVGLCSAKFADKSLGRSTSLCRRAELILSLQTRVCSSVELQVFSCYRGWKEACQVTRVISTTWRTELSLICLLANQRAETNSSHSDRNVRGLCIIV